MALRAFQYRETWGEDWFLDLPLGFRVFYLFLRHHCDHAGVWAISRRVAEFTVGEKLDFNQFLEIMAGRVVELDGERWWLCRFIEEQLGGVVQVEYGYHAPYVKAIESNGLKRFFSEFTNEKGKLCLKYEGLDFEHTGSVGGASSMHEGCTIDALGKDKGCDGVASLMHSNSNSSSRSSSSKGKIPRAREDDLRARKIAADDAGVQEVVKCWRSTWKRTKNTIKHSVYVAARIGLLEIEDGAISRVLSVDECVLAVREYRKKYDMDCLVDSKKAEFVFSMETFFNEEGSHVLEFLPDVILEAEAIYRDPLELDCDDEEVEDEEEQGEVEDGEEQEEERRREEKEECDRRRLAEEHDKEKAEEDCKIAESVKKNGVALREALKKNRKGW